MTSAEEAPSAPKIVIRQAKTDEDERAIFDLIAGNAVEEMTEAPFDPEVFAINLRRTVEEGAALMAVVDGHLVGWLGIVPKQYSYSRASFLIDSMFWVLPQYRGGDAWLALLQEVRGIVDATGMEFKLVINNPSRHRGSRADKARTADILGYKPAGSVLTFYPRGH